MNVQRTILAIGMIAAAFGEAAVAAETGNWMRDYVEMRSQAVLERAIGSRRAAAIRPSATPNIVGGQPAGPNANPFQVALLYKGEPNNALAQYCGGTLYKPNVVVTAAHCSDFVTPGSVQVLTGTRQLDGTGTRRNVSKIFIHPAYNATTADSDVAVWKLSSSATGIETARLAQLPTELKSGKTLATGWGRTNSYPEYPIALRQVIMPLQPRSDCNDADSYHGQITQNMICAGLDTGGRDSCQGDSGGPLTVRVGNSGGVDKYDVLIGITSWGGACAAPELFGVYTRVAKFKDWIDAQAGK